MLRIVLEKIVVAHRISVGIAVITSRGVINHPVRQVAGNSGVGVGTDGRVVSTSVVPRWVITVTHVKLLSSLLIFSLGQYDNSQRQQQ